LEWKEFGFRRWHWKRTSKGGILGCDSAIWSVFMTNFIHCKIAEIEQWN
jgi:hypothetical protein